MKDVGVTPASLDLLARNGTLSAPALARARELAGIVPDAKRWLRFLDIAMGLGGALMLATALVFFIAYNWTDMGRFAKLGLLEAALVATGVLAIRLDARRWPGRAAHFASIVVTGALLAFIGQTYQTGADPWQLFAAWAVLSVPWALAAAWAPTWALVLVIANLAVALGLGWRTGLLGWLGGESSMPVTLTVFNAAALLAAELWGPRGDDGVHRLLPRLAAALALGAATFGGVIFFLDGRGEWDLLLTYVACLAAVMGVYRFKKLDVLLLTMASLSAIVVTSTMMGKWLIKGESSYAGFLALCVIVIAMSAGAAQWIKSLVRAETR